MFRTVLSFPKHLSIAPLSKVRRNMSNISCDDMGRVILQDIAPRSVSRCESKTAAALQACSRTHFQQLLHHICEMERNEWLLSFYGYKQDATNDKRYKRSTLELSTGYLLGTTGQDCDVSWESDGVCMKRLSDVLPSVDETAPGTLGFTLKALESLGCPSWDAIKQWSVTVTLVFDLHFVSDTIEYTGKENG